MSKSGIPESKRRRFVADVATAEVPKGTHGRLTRLVIDIDNRAVHDYIMFDSTGASAPWFAAVLDELFDVFAEWASREEATAAWMDRSQQGERR